MTLPFTFTSSDAASIFDLFAEDSLRSSLKPAWNYLMRFLTQKHPNVLLDMLKYSDEMFYVVLFIMEEYNLRNKSASLTESFYILRRECTASSTSFLFRHAKAISLLSIVVLPYLQDKMEARFEKVKERISCNDPGIRDFDRFVYKWYPMVITLTKWLRMINYLLYLFRYTGYAFPLLNLTGIQLKYNTASEAKSSNDGTQQDERSMLRRVITKPLDMMSYSVTKIAPLFFYSLSFLETYYQQDTWTQNPLLSKGGGESLTAPSMPKVLSNTVKLPSSKKHCPLCHQPRQNPSTLPVSGFVFCYRCIHDYVQRHGCCPVTYRPCQINNIIQLHS